MSDIEENDKFYSFFVDGCGNVYRVIVKNESVSVDEYDPIDGQIKNYYDVTDAMAQAGEVAAKDVSKFMADDNYLYFMVSKYGSDVSKLLVLDRECHLVAVCPSITDFTVKNGTIYTVKSYGLQVTGITKQQIENADITEELFVDLTHMSLWKAYVSVDATSDDIYIASNKVVYKLSDDQIDISQIITPDKNAPALLENDITSIAVIDSRIYCAMANIDKFQTHFAEYAQNDISSDKKKCTLTVTAPYRDPFILKAISVYEKNHSGERINYDFEYPTKELFLKNYYDDKYLEKMNLRLIAGEVGDIVILDSEVWDIMTMFSSEMFADLSQLADEMSGETIHGLVYGAKVGQYIRGIPLNAGYFYMQVNDTLCREMDINLDWENVTWMDVLALAERFETSDNYLFSYYGDASLQRLLHRILISNMPDLIDPVSGWVELDQPFFEELMNMWKEVSCKKNFVKVKDINGGRAGITTDALISIDYKAGYISDEDFLQTDIFTLKDEGINISYYPMPCGEKASNRTACSSYVSAVLSRSENKDTAYEFIRTALSYEVQSSASMSWIPVNEKAESDYNDKQLERARRAGKINENSEGEKIKIQFSIVHHSVDYIYDMFWYKSMLSASINEFVSGEKTFDQAIKQAQDAIWFKINE